MAGGIYLVQGDNSLVELGEQGYVTESILQGLLADYPNLMAGDQINPGSPRRWLFVKREAAVPSEEGGGGRWALDHLFLDQDAIPTLVEVKRASDNRIRREVVGQMLDYAANAVVYWPGESIRSQFEVLCLAAGKVSNDVLAEFLGEELEPEAYWRLVDENLRAGKIRMIFVADVIPTELQRIVEFLNEQMRPAQVLALEVRQFKGAGLTALVPKVIGQTALALQKEGTSEKRQWDERSFFETLAAMRGAADADVAKSLLDWARERGLRVWWGKGKREGSFFPMVDHASSLEWTISVWTTGTVEVQFAQLAREGHPFAAEGKRMELLTRLNTIPGMVFPRDAITKRPNRPLSTFVDPAVRDQLLGVLDWLVTELRAGAQTS
ncbi:MAG: hypothetical protein M3R06_03475 [Chloroflexota bacterium]|nr:hypothetical protein [Chloroflexota bacterium]